MVRAPLWACCYQESSWLGSCSILQLPHSSAVQMSIVNEGVVIDAVQAARVNWKSRNSLSGRQYHLGMVSARIWSTLIMWLNIRFSNSTSSLYSSPLLDLSHTTTPSLSSILRTIIGPSYWEHTSNYLDSARNRQCSEGSQEWRIPYVPIIHCEGRLNPPAISHSARPASLSVLMALSLIGLYIVAATAQISCL